jgi:hypothetical protein
MIEWTGGQVKPMDLSIPCRYLIGSVKKTGTSTRINPIITHTFTPHDMKLTTRNATPRHPYKA